MLSVTIQDNCVNNLLDVLKQLPSEFVLPDLSVAQELPESHCGIGTKKPMLVYDLALLSVPFGCSLVRMIQSQ